MTTSTSTKPADTRLGALAVERGLLTQGELDAVLERAWPTTTHAARRALLGELLVKERFLGATLLAELLQEQRARQRGAKAAPEAPPPAKAAPFGELLRELDAPGARALVLVAGRAPAVRFVDGLEPLARPPVTAEEVDAFRREIFGERATGAVATTAFARGSKHYRAACGDSHQGRSVVIQRTGLDARTDALKIPANVAELAEHRRGLVLVTGPRSAAVADTLARLIAAVSASSRRHVIAIERNPIYDHASSRGLVAQRAVGEHTKSFETALRAALREDPDVIAIGEMREPEAIATALLAAETGHLVIAGVHAADATQALRRMIAAQSASRRALGRATLANTLQALAVVDVVRGRSERHVIADIIPGTTAVANLIREDRLHHLDATIKNQPGTVSRDELLVKLAGTGEVRLVAALEHAADPASLARLERSPTHG